MEPRNGRTENEKRIDSLRSTMRDLRTNIYALESVVPRLEEALARRIRGDRGVSTQQVQNSHNQPTGEDHAVQSTLTELKTNVAGLRDSVPSIERTIHQRRGHITQDGDQSRVVSTLSEYIDDIRRRLDALRFVIPRLESILSGGTIAQETVLGDPVASVRDAFAPLGSQLENARVLLGELEPAMNDLKSRVHAIEDVVPRLQQGLVAGVEDFSIPEVWEPIPVPLPRPAAGVVLAEPAPALGYALRAPWWSKGRLKGLALLTAALVMLAAFGTAWYFNGTFTRQRFAKQTVLRMQNAPSYRAIGIDSIGFSTGRSMEIREEFSFVHPDQVKTKFLTSGDTSVQCRNKDIIVISADRFQLCNDVDAPDYLRQWNRDAYDSSVFQTSLFQPWIRFAWCHDFRELEGKQKINGVENRVFACQVPNIREADTIWSRDSKGDYELNIKDSQQRDRFLKEAVIDITVWVRETDGYIGRFVMKKSAPDSGGSGTDSETVDYQYTDFGLINSIPPPSNAPLVVGGVAATTGDQSGTTNGSGGATSGGETSAEAAEFDSTDDRLANARLAVLNGHVINLEVAADLDTLGRGLSNRPLLARDSGMLFILPRTDIWTFWMKDVLIDLDVLFLDENGVIVDIQTMRAEFGVDDTALQTYDSRAPAKYAIEMNAGLATEFGLSTGTTVQFQQ